MIRMLKRDGSISYGFFNPDGSWVELPPDDRSNSGRAPVEQAPTPTTSVSAPTSVRQFLRQIARKGGLARAAKHNREEISAWGRVRYKTKSGIVNK